MIVNDKIEGFINSLGFDLNDELKSLEEYAISNNVPIIRRTTQMYLKFLLEERRPKNILEIGTAIGFSALFFSSYSPEGTKITTIEKVEMRLKEARKNLKGHSDILLLEGDALKLLDELALNHTERYDFIFLDSAKGQYLKNLEPIRKLLSPDGLLVTDNVLLEGTIAESKFTIERRDRTIHMRMREYLYELTHSSDFTTAILPIGDGISVSLHKV